MSGITKEKANINYIIEVLREMAYILFDQGFDFDIVIKIKTKNELIQ
jgi:hypothetical protein